MTPYVIDRFQPYLTPMSLPCGEIVYEDQAGNIRGECPCHAVWGVAEIHIYKDSAVIVRAKLQALALNLKDAHQIADWMKQARSCR